MGNTKVKELIASLQEQCWLSDPNVYIVHTSTYHASAKTAGHQDNLSANYGLTDYGASKVMQTLQFAAAIYALDTRAVQSIPYKRLLELKVELDKQLELWRGLWAAAAENKAAADELFEDSKGDQSILVQLQKFSNRFDV